MKRGKEHPVIAFGLKLREVFLDLGFDEIINPMIVDEREVYLQYGKEAPLILDRVFYLAGLDRTDIGLSREKLLKVREIIPSFSKEEELKAFLRSFKEGKIEGDDFLEEMVKALSISKEEAVEIVDKVFTEFRELKPIPSGKTLRSHMTANWFGALSHLKNRRPLPIKLFSIGPRFRREQRQDAHHLYESTSASLVVADSNFTLSDGQELTTEILKRVGFPSLEFKKKEVFSNYYEAETDTEIMINLKGEEIEIANLGFYAKDALLNYEIPCPVFNLGFGVERLAMLKSREEDLRSLVYPQFAKELFFSDKEIAESLRPAQKPKIKESQKIADILSEFMVKHSQKIGPTKILAYAGSLAGGEVEIYLYNWDEGKNLISLAGLNEVYVCEGEIIGLPPSDLKEKVPAKFRKIYEEGIRTGLKFLSLIAKGFVAEFEQMIEEGKDEHDLKLKMVKRPQEINLEIPEHIYQYITSRNKKINISGPLFFGIYGKLVSS